MCILVQYEVLQKYTLILVKALTKILFPLDKKEWFFCVWCVCVYTHTHRLIFIQNKCVTAFGWNFKISATPFDFPWCTANIQFFWLDSKKLLRQLKQNAFKQTFLTEHNLSFFYLHTESVTFWFSKFMYHSFLLYFPRRSLCTGKFKKKYLQYYVMVVKFL